jgi:dCMP deaminase
MDIAKRCAEMSYAVRKKVGCVIVKDGNIIAMGWNGMPAGMPNECEYKKIDPKTFNDELVTNPEVSHAEENAIAKLARGTTSSANATAYVTLEPCIHCAKILYNAGIIRVVVGEAYRSHEGTEFLIKQRVEMAQIQ